MNKSGALPGGWPAAAAAATGIQVGAAIVATRFVIEQTDPAALAMMRYIIGAGCLLPFALRPPRVRIARRDLLPIAVLGTLQFGVLIALMNVGLQFIASAPAALILATFPLLTMLLAAALGHERLTVAKTTGVLFTLIGIALALGRGLLEGGTQENAWMGIVALFAAALSGAVCSIFYRTYVRQYPIAPVGALAMTASVFFLSVIAAAEGFFRQWPSFTAGGWLAIAFIGASSGVGYYLWLWALRHTTPTRVTIFLALSPATAAVLGALLLGEAITPGTLAGLVCIAIGLWIAQRGREDALVR